MNKIRPCHDGVLLGHARPVPSSSQAPDSQPLPGPGFLMINGDDWGETVETTDKILDCVALGTVTSVSALVFMADSERAAELARERQIDAGLHMNFVSPNSGSSLPARLSDHLDRTSRYLLRNRFAPALFNPLLIGSFEYLMSRQLDEYRRIYGKDPLRVDGHHHMHLSANVLLQGLLPPRTVVRRNFCFEPRERSVWNRYYRSTVDYHVSRKHRLADFFFSMAPLQPKSRLQKIYSLARGHVVEIETHPVHADEYHYLAKGGILQDIGNTRLGVLCP